MSGRDLENPGYRGGLPEHYEPAEGLKAMAVAEAAESHFRRAKDATALYAAVETKLGEQRRFVLWWDGQEKRRGTGLPSQITDGRAAADFGLDRDTIHRWRRRLVGRPGSTDPAKFNHALAQAKERCLKVCEEKQSERASNTGEPDWYTPPEFVEAARAVLGGIDLDPATNPVAQEVIKASRYFTAADDGLAQEWSGRVWLNPPYSHPEVKLFVEKLVESHQSGAVPSAILLTNNSTDTGWYQAVARVAGAICFPAGRIRFLDKEGEEAATPLQGQSFCYFGQDVQTFEEVFGEFGFVVGPRPRRRRR